MNFFPFIMRYVYNIKYYIELNLLVNYIKIGKLFFSINF